MSKIYPGTGYSTYEGCDSYTPRRTQTTGARRPQPSTTRRTNPNTKVRTNSHGDYIEVSTRSNLPVKKEETGLVKLRKNVVKGVAGVSAAAMLVAGGMKIGDSLKPVEPNFNAFNHTVVEVADYTSVDPRAIILANSIKNDKEILGEIILPSQYSMYGDEISKLEEKLSDNKLSGEKRAKLQEELDTLKEKQAKQDALADVYVDDDHKFAYILPHERGRLAETIKDAFGIKDGVIKSWNNLNFEWATDGTEDMVGHYRDYTYSTIPESGIKVPFDALGKAK